LRPFADTNWLEASYIEPDPRNALSVRRSAIARKRNEKEGPLLTSQIVLLEARNVFARVTKAPAPEEWKELQADFNAKIFVDPMDWDLLRQAAGRIFERFSHKAPLGTFDVAIIASAELAGAREILSFDENLKATAFAVGFKVYPDLTAEGRSFLAKLKARI
jgi:predicted nucleic acid-binding protein